MMTSLFVGETNGTASIEEAGLIIAAAAVEHGLTVATRDRSDYDRARALVINPWEV